MCFPDGGPCNLGYVEKIYKQNHLIPDGNKNAGQKFKLMVRTTVRLLFLKRRIQLFTGIENEDIIKINELKQGYFYDLLNNRNTELVDMHLDTMSLYHDNRFNRNIMYIYKDLEKTIDIAKKYKISKNKLHKLSLEWINLEAYEIFNGF